MEVGRPGTLLPVKEKNTLRAGVGVVPRHNPPRHCRGSTQPHLSACSLLGNRAGARDAALEQEASCGWDEAGAGQCRLGLLGWRVRAHHDTHRRGVACHGRQHWDQKNPTSIAILPGLAWGTLQRSGLGVAWPLFITALGCTEQRDVASDSPGPAHVASFPLITTH